jgi:hypothetical protein
MCRRFRAKANTVLNSIESSATVGMIPRWRIGELTARADALIKS